MKHLFIRFNAISFFAILFLVFLISCKKLEIETSKQVENEIAKETSSTLKSSNKKSKYNSIKEIINATGKSKLTNFITKLKTKYNARTIEQLEGIPNDALLEEEAAQILQPMNSEILTYLSETYPQFGSTSMIDINDPDFFYFAIVYSLAEQSGFINPANSTNLTAQREIPAWIQCVGGVLGVTAIYELVSGAATATYSSTWSVIKRLAKRYAGWIGVGLALWEISTECF